MNGDLIAATALRSYSTYAVHSLMADAKFLPQPQLQLSHYCQLSASFSSNSTTSKSSTPKWLIQFRA